MPIDHNNRKCEVKNCHRLGQKTGYKLKDGTPCRSKFCTIHCKAKYKTKGWHVIFRKTYCENRDGRLGFKCNYKVRYEGQLGVDHIDGDNSNNNEKNLQTLCHNCHSYKTYINEDYRKTKPL